MNELTFCSLHPVLQEGSLESRLAKLNPAWCWQPASEDAQPLGRLLKDDVFAQQAVLTFQKAHQAPTAKVAASLVHKQWVAHLLSPLVAVHLLSGRPISPWQQLGYDVQASRLGWTTQPFGENESPALFFDTVTGIANACFALFRRNFSVSPRILWSNTALAMASPWSRLQPFEVDGNVINRQLVAFFSHFPPSLAQSVQWLTITQGDKTVCMPRRLSCCLKYALPGKGKALCGTCQRRSEAEQVALINQRFFKQKA
ncbi:(2Fe-2S)-binding protein [Enterovibrio paralichthyis]|uniref:(2Fe-2S)-binding protein n=1 Tax=Enterovibrio paralichthyis TaxID=2853805 RepID=UPI001C46F772|nr:(2Fe-2S)-binding protein [Enterovibrio paralichthyis]